MAMLGETHDRPDVIGNPDRVFTHQRLAHLGESVSSEECGQGHRLGKVFIVSLKHDQYIPRWLGYNAVIVFDAFKMTSTRIVLALPSRFFSAFAPCR